MNRQERAVPVAELPPEDGDPEDDPTLAAAALAYWLAGKRAESRGTSDGDDEPRRPRRESGVRGFKRVELTESGVLPRPP